MARQETRGRCELCGAEFGKRAMTRHLRSCIRKMRVAARQGRDDVDLERVFHIVVEGRGSPQYWMHLLVPADASLEDLDDFLRDEWLECCGHLSSFEIAGRRFESHPEQLMPAFGEDEEDETSGTSGFPASPIGMAVPEIPAGSALEAVLEMMGDSPEEFERNQQSFAKLTEALTDEEERLGGNLSEDDVRRVLSRMRNVPEPVKKLLAHSPEEIVLAMQAMEVAAAVTGATLEESDSGLDVELSEVLRPGTRFRHEYDYGTTTELNLQVDAAYEVLASDEDDLVQVLAQNDMPSVTCGECGNRPAEFICSQCSYLEEGWLCEPCSRKHDCEDQGIEYAQQMLLPVVNSPRVGMCGYTGKEADDH